MGFWVIKQQLNLALSHKKEQQFWLVREVLGGALIKTVINRILAEATMWSVYLFEGLMGLIAQHSNFLTITASKIMNSIQLF